VRGCDIIFSDVELNPRVAKGGFEVGISGADLSRSLLFLKNNVDRWGIFGEDSFDEEFLRVKVQEASFIFLSHTRSPWRGKRAEGARSSGVPGKGSTAFFVVRLRAK